MSTSFINTKIDTNRLTLRPLTPRDANILYKIMSDSEGKHCQKTDVKKPKKETINFISNTTMNMDTTTKITFGLIRKSDHALIGICILFNLIKNSKTAEIGYSLTSGAWNFGKNYMSEALFGFLSFAFTRLNLNLIEAKIDPRNTDSVRFLERLGFHKENYLKQRWVIQDKLVDSEIYGLLKEEWQLIKKPNN